MAGLSGAAGVIAVIQISEQIISCCSDYYQTAKNAKDDIINIINVVRGLKGTFVNLRNLVNKYGQDPETLNNLKSLTQQGSLEQCEENIRKAPRGRGN
jgi:hypothetical protein